MSFSRNMKKEEFSKAVKDRILQDVNTVMTRNSEQDQLLACGEILILLEIADGMGIPVRQELSIMSICNKAFDFAVEARHWNCEALRERNRSLPIK